MLAAPRGRANRLGSGRVDRYFRNTEVSDSDHVEGGGGTSEMGDQSDDCDLRWSPQASAPSSTMRRHGDQQRYHDARPVATKDVPKTSPARSASTPVNAVEIALQRPNSDDCFCGYLSRGASPIRSSFSLTWLPSRWSASFCSCSL